MNMPEMPLEPAEDIVVGHCAWCGDEIYAGESVFSGDEGMIHIGCLKELIHKNFTEDELAEMCGFEREVVGVWTS